MHHEVRKRALHVIFKLERRVELEIELHIVTD